MECASLWQEKEASMLILEIKMHQLLVVVIDKYNVIFFGLQSINGFDTMVEKFKTLITLIQK